MVGASPHITGRSAEASSTYPGQALTSRMFPDIATRACRVRLPRLNHCCGPRSIPMAVTGILESWSGPRGRKGEGPRVCPCVCVSGRQQVLGSAVNHRSLSQHRGSGALGRTGLQLPRTQNFHAGVGSDRLGGIHPLPLCPAGPARGFLPQ